MSNVDDDEGFLDIENLIHRVHVISNLLLAYNGKERSIPPWIQQLQDLILFCNGEAKIIRENFYVEVEDNFVYYNELVDIPIVSEDQ